MNRPTPDQEREFYLQALTAAAPIVAVMETNEQRSLIRNYDTGSTPDKILQYHREGSLKFHALTTMADLLWEHIMRFQGTGDTSLEDMTKDQSPGNAT